MHAVILTLTKNQSVGYTIHIQGGPNIIGWQ